MQLFSCDPEQSNIQNFVISHSFFVDLIIYRGYPPSHQSRKDFSVVRSYNTKNVLNLLFWNFSWIRGILEETCQIWKFILFSYATRAFSEKWRISLYLFIFFYFIYVGRSNKKKNKKKNKKLYFTFPSPDPKHTHTAKATEMLTFHFVFYFVQWILPASYVYFCVENSLLYHLTWYELW